METGELRCSTNLKTGIPQRPSVDDLKAERSDQFDDSRLIRCVIASYEHDEAIKTFFTAVRNVRFWHKADMAIALHDVRFWEIKRT